MPLIYSVRYANFFLVKQEKIFLSICYFLTKECTSEGQLDVGPSIICIETPELYNSKAQLEVTP